MAAVASQPPIRTPAGGTTDQIFQPLADCGNGNPFFYHMFSDDFDPYRSTDYNVVTTGTGAAVAAVSGDGGLVRFTLGTTAGTTSLQHSNGNQSFTLNSQPKKVFFECRFQLSSAAYASGTVVVGLTQFSATPGTVTDGVYFQWNGTTLTINSANASAITSVTIPAAAYTMANNTNIDMAFYITRLGDVLAYVDTQLVGFIPQSNIGTTGNPQNAGAVARITAPSLTSAVLTPTMAYVQAGAVANTMTIDFFQAQKER